MLLLEFFHLLKSLIQHLLGVSALLLSLVSKVFGTIRFLSSLFLFFSDYCLLFFGVLLISGETNKEFWNFLVFLFELRLHFSELDFHFFDFFIGGLKFFETSSESVGLESDFFSFGWKDLFVHGEKFQVRCGSDVIVPIQLLQEEFTVMFNWLVDWLEHFNKFWNSTLNSELSFIIDKLSLTDVNQGFFGPLSEPIDCGAVDQWGEHSQSGCELVSQWRHNNNHVDVSLNSDQILGKDVGFCRWQTLFGAVTLACCCNIFHVLFLINACHIAAVQDTIDVFQHLFVDNLSIAEQETDWLVLQTCQQEHLFNVFSPWPHVVTFCQFDLEQFVTCQVSGHSR